MMQKVKGTDKFIGENKADQKCTEEMCCLKLLFNAKLAQQVSQLNGFFPSWIMAMCVFKEDFSVNFLSQMWHSNGFLLSWNETICFFKFDLGSKKEWTDFKFEIQINVL